MPRRKCHGTNQFKPHATCEEHAWRPVSGSWSTPNSAMDAGTRATRRGQVTIFTPKLADKCRRGTKPPPKRSEKPLWDLYFDDLFENLHAALDSQVMDTYENRTQKLQQHRVLYRLRAASCLLPFMFSCTVYVQHDVLYRAVLALIEWHPKSPNPCQTRLHVNGTWHKAHFKQPRTTSVFIVSAVAGPRLCRAKDISIIYQ